MYNIISTRWTRNSIYRQTIRCEIAIWRAIIASITSSRNSSAKPFSNTIKSSGAFITRFLSSLRLEQTKWTFSLMWRSNGSIITNSSNSSWSRSTTSNIRSSISPSTEIPRMTIPSGSPIINNPQTILPSRTWPTISSRPPPLERNISPLQTSSRRRSPLSTPGPLITQFPKYSICRFRPLTPPLTKVPNITFPRLHRLPPLHAILPLRTLRTIPGVLQILGRGEAPLGTGLRHYGAYGTEIPRCARLGSTYAL